MKILWFTWKDIKHPEKGGAEIVTDAICSRLVKDGHTVTLLTSHYKGAPVEDTIHGYRVIRVGGRVTVYLHAFFYYLKHLRGTHDIIIEEVNTVPFFSKIYTTGKSFLFFHQLAREIWFYQMPFPVSIVGYILEPLYLRLLSLPRKNLRVATPKTLDFKDFKTFDYSVITISESTKTDLTRYGFKGDNIAVISEGIEIDPAPDLNTPKVEVPTILSLGAIRPMKRTLDIVKAFEMVKQTIPEAKLVIAGDDGGAYGDKVKAEVVNSPHKSDIQLLGKVSIEAKITLMRTSHVLAVTSLKEGWGLVVTEANSQGTPAVVYNVDGLRDSVKDGKTGIVANENTPQSLADGIVRLLASQEDYENMRQVGWEWSKEITFDKQYTDFKKAVNL